MAFFTLIFVLVVVIIVAAVMLISMIMQGDDQEGTRDKGVKQRIASDPANKLPVAYGKQKVAGSITMADISDDDATMYFIISLCEGPVYGVEKVIYGDQLLTFDGDITTGLRDVTKALEDNGTGKEKEQLIGNLRVRFYPHGGRCSEMESNSTKWSNNAEYRAMPDTAYVYCELDYDREERVTGLNGKFHFYLEGKLVRSLAGNPSAKEYYDRTPQYSNNPAECSLDYLVDTMYGCSVPLDDIDINSFYEHYLFCNTPKVSLSSATEEVAATGGDWTDGSSSCQETDTCLQYSDNSSLATSGDSSSGGMETYYMSSEPTDYSPCELPLGVCHGPYLGYTYNTTLPQCLGLLADTYSWRPWRDVWVSGIGRTTNTEGEECLTGFSWNCNAGLYLPEGHGIGSTTNSGTQACSYCNRGVCVGEGIYWLACLDDPYPNYDFGNWWPNAPICGDAAQACLFLWDYTVSSTYDATIETEAWADYAYGYYST
jgi:hypothetical protein